MGWVQIYLYSTMELKLSKEWELSCQMSSNKFTPFSIFELNLSEEWELSCQMSSDSLLFQLFNWTDPKSRNFRAKWVQIHSFFNFWIELIRRVGTFMPDEFKFTPFQLLNWTYPKSGNFHAKWVQIHSFFNFWIEFIRRVGTFMLLKFRFRELNCHTLVCMHHAYTCHNHP